MTFFQKTLSSVAYTVCSHRKASDVSSLSTPYNDVYRFVEGQIKALAPFLSLPMVFAVFLFGLSPLIRHGRFFHRLNLDQRIAWMQIWKDSPIGVFRDFVYFHESLALMALFSREEFLDEN